MGCLAAGRRPHSMLPLHWRLIDLPRRPPDWCAWGSPDPKPRVPTAAGAASRGTTRALGMQQAAAP
eukprot:scaffold18946_cov63-Phaeocystis_antarctica.AAC.2